MNLDVDAAGLVLAFDRAGIVAFALGGVEVGMRRRLDVFGLLVMGIVTATGGGLIRDVTIGRVPFVLEHADYLLLATLSSAAGIALAWRRRTIPTAVLAIAGAAGLGAFSVAGALAGIESGLPLPAVIVLAIVTANGGGVIRDLLADRVPLVLRAEVNATAAAIGGFVVWAVEPVSAGAAALAGVLVAASVRVATIALDLHLPIPGGRRPDEDDPVS